MQIDPHNIVLYRSVYTGEQIDTLLGLIRPSKTLAEDLDARVKVIEDKLSPKVVLTIQQMDFTGGTNIQSPAGGEIIAVEDLPRGYKCYFDTNHGSEPVLFHVNDQAMGRRYDIGTTTDNYFWRLVTEVGADYIVLSKTDCDPTSGAPAVGDKVITVGNRYDIARQNIKISSTIGENRDEWYAGISSYNLENKLVTVVGVKNGQVGIWTENGYFSGEIHITGGQGLDNLEEWEEAAQQISDAWAKAVKAETDAANAQYTADAAALQAERIELKLERINSDTVLDITEKKVIRTEWITINGREDLDRTGNKGSYFKTRNLYDQYASLGGRVLFSYNGVEYTFNGAEYTYKSIGLSALDAAYLALREYLREVGLNDRTTVFEGFDRKHLADLLTAYYDAEKQVNDNITAAVKERIEQAKAEVLQELAGFQEAIEGQLEEMQDVIDNTIETWFMDGAPSLVSPPASDWTTDELKERHLGDLYYDNLTGYAYRFQYGDNKYFWKYIEDSALAKALAAAARAQDTADGKRRTFLSQPTAADAYDPGDMWLHATVGDYANETLVCITAKVSGVSFSAAHWTKASKYTDDTVANVAKSAAEAAQATADDAATAAAAAQATADSAAAAAAAANTRLNGWASDGSISPVEKEALRQQKADIIQEYGEYINQATIYGVSTTAYIAAYDAALAALTKYTATTPENITIGSDYADIAGYFSARTTIAQAIAAAAKKVATDAQAAADAAQATADQAVGLANAAQVAANAAQAAADAAQEAADAAQDDADAANTRLNGWASDGSISPLEKTSLSQQKDEITAEYAGIRQQALAYNLDTQAYDDAYDDALAALTKYTAASPENITIGSDYADIAAYYAARTTITTAIAAAAKAAAAEAKSIADSAMTEAVRLKEALEHINSDTVLDIAEKKSLRTEWITINGLEDLDRSGGRGSYYLTKRLLEQYSNLGKQTTFVYNGVEYSFGGVEYTFALSGTSALDAAYLALREYLREVGLNDRTTVFEGFDRKHLADLLTAYYDAERLVNDSITQAVKDGMEAVREEMLAELAGFQETMEQQLEEMQDVIDNTIETHFAGGTPTLSNYPANQWTTDELKQRHLGDLYYDNASQESSATSGFAFRFERSGSAGSYTYFWHQLSDNAIAEALAKAARAQDTADGKRRTFLSQPTTADAYDRGDMWLHATIGDYTNETLVCLTSKAAGTAFQASHWGLASKYTDDTVANLARQEAAAAQSTANSAAQAASAAQTAADNAATAAAAANTRLNGWASDGSISPVEKEALRQQKKDIVAERADIVAQATAYNVSSTAYMAAYNAALAALNKYTATSPENITIESDYANIEAYYTARSTILQAIAAAAKKVATDAQAAADAAQHAAEVADGKAEAAAAAAAAVAAAVANINDDTILDPSEKGEIRTTWISINGVLDTDKHGQTGTYAAAKEAIDKAAGASLPVQFTYAGIIYTFAGVEYTFQNLGAASLDAAYLALREYLSGLQINTMESFLGFDRSMYSQLLRDYNVALNNVLKALSDIATEKADDALSSIELINAALEKMGSDNYISAQEKLTLKTALQDESVVYSTLQAQADRYSTQAVQTALSAYNTAYTHFGNTVTYYCEDFPWANDVAISADHPLSRISAYYTAREALVDAIHAAEKAAIDSKANTADFQYLKTALPANAMTEITGGLVLANILGVKNDAGNVVAAMNGVGTITGFKDATHGVLLIAAGISSISTAKDTAATRIFADGSIFTNKIYATGGTIGGFNISGNYLGLSMDQGGSPSGNGLSLFDSFISFYDNTGANEEISAMFGTNILPASVGIRGLARLYAKSTDYIDSLNGTIYGLILNVSGFYNPYAVYCEEGVFAGFRPNISIANDGKLLGPMDSIITCGNSSSVNFTLPASPKHGQFYALIHSSATTMNIISTATHPIVRVVSSGVEVVASTQSGSPETVLLVYNANSTITYNGASRSGVWTLTYLKVS